MFRSPSPYAPPDTHYNAPYAPQQQQQQPPSHISPGSITYTTSTGADGKIVYHPFKAVPASYQTPSGIVSGIQWVPAEATSILPTGAQPASTDFAEAWTRGNLTREDKHALREWQRDEEKRRRREEKDATKRRDNRLSQARYDDADLRYAREQDAVTRERRKSFNQGVAFPPGTGGGYSPSASPYQAPGSHSPYTRERKYSSGGGLMSDLDRQFNDLGVADERIAGPGIARPRKYSTSGGAERPLSGYGNVGSYSPNAGAYPPRPHSRNTSPYPAVPQYTNPSPGLRSAEPAYVPRPSSPYANANYPSSPNHVPVDPYARAASPYSAPQEIYPSGHVMEGQSMFRSRPTTPLMGPGAAPYPVNLPGVQSVTGSISAGQLASNTGQLAAPDCFSRPINAAHPYTPFETMKIQNMDDFYNSVPRMPAVLNTHDVYPDDWTRLVEDVSLAWSGRLPVPSPNPSRPPKRATVTTTLVDLWNTSFFNRRGIELVLYKGRERRSGPNAGIVDLHHTSRDYDDEDDDESSDTESSEDDDDEDEQRYNAAAHGMYGGRPGYGPPPEVKEMRNKRLAAKAERRRRRKEKKYRRKERERSKMWSLYLTCIPQGPQVGSGLGGAYSTSAYGGNAYTAATSPRIGQASPHIGAMGLQRPTTPNGGWGAQPGLQRPTTPNGSWGAQPGMQRSTTPNGGWGAYPGAQRPTTPGGGYGALPPAPGYAGSGGYGSQAGSVPGGYGSGGIVYGNPYA